MSVPRGLADCPAVRANITFISNRACGGSRQERKAGDTEGKESARKSQRRKGRAREARAGGELPVHRRGLASAQIDSVSMGPL